MTSHVLSSINQEIFFDQSLFDFITCVIFCTEFIITQQRRAESLAVIAYFQRENVNKHGLF